MIENIYGLRVICSPYVLTKGQFRFPRTKKKRIMKKWGKKESNFKDIPGMLKMGSTLLVHPMIYDRIKKLEGFYQEL